ncbi:MAG: hypothetical protein GY839_12100 [candidate division Zixibacteria bacterium]|nr:hypothetical protein [candidate division Zixibacteria bacterium]
MEAKTRHKISKALDKASTEKAFKYFRRMLKNDEFQKDRIGEYGFNVPSSFRSPSQKDSTAPTQRINAFYTYCAFEYYKLYEGNSTEFEQDRILSLVSNKLASDSYYYINRIEDGYMTGTHDSIPHLELNYRHTFALSLILALDDKDTNKLRRIKELILTDGVQAKNGGWPIWEKDTNNNAATDIVCSCYAVILLDYFLKRSIENKQKLKLKEKLDRTFDFFIDSLDKDSYIWRDNSDSYAGSHQMTTWYFTIISEILFLKDREYGFKICNSLLKAISKSNIQLLGDNAISWDIKIRICTILINFSEYFCKSVDKRVIELFREILISHEKITSLTTFALTRILMTLKIIMEDSIYSKSMSSNDDLNLHRILGLTGTLLGRFFKEFAS